MPRSVPAVRLLLLGALALLASTHAEAKDRPNLIFFLADDLRSDLLGCAGHPILKTPTVDRLAREGIRFSNAFVTTSICAASRASIFTGVHERTHRYTFGTPPIRSELVAASYPALLKRAGYRTGFVGKFGVNIEGNTSAMFDSFVPLNRSPYLKKQKDGSTRHVSEIAGDRAIEFLRESAKSKEGTSDASPTRTPFCLSVSFNAPHAEDGDKENHYPWPKAVDGLYDDVVIPPPRLGEPAVFESQPGFLKESLNRVRWFWRWDTPEKWQKNVRAYFRMISGIDGVMGRVLAELETLGLAENTVIVFAADNGYYLGSRGFAGKWSHYEESLRVPLVVFDPRAPRERRGLVEEAMALNIDLPATFLALGGVDVPATYTGASLLPWLVGERPKGWRTDFFCEHLMEHGQIPKWDGVRDQRWVYARYFEQTPPFEFLHDLETDPDELRNLAVDPAHADVLARFRARTDVLRDALGGPYDPSEVRRFRERRSQGAGSAKD